MRTHQVSITDNGYIHFKYPSDEPKTLTTSAIKETPEFREKICKLIAELSVEHDRQYR